MRPGEGDVLARRPDGSPVLRYQFASCGREIQGTVEECALYAGLGVDFVKDIPSAAELVERLWRECEAASGISK
jgi:nitronate monooxygenase